MIITLLTINILIVCAIIGLFAWFRFCDWLGEKGLPEFLVPALAIGTPFAFFVTIYIATKLY